MWEIFIVKIDWKKRQQSGKQRCQKKQAKFLAGDTLSDCIIAAPGNKHQPKRVFIDVIKKQEKVLRRPDSKYQGERNEGDRQADPGKRPVIERGAFDGACHEK